MDKKTDISKDDSKNRKNFQEIFNNIDEKTLTDIFLETPDLSSIYPDNIGRRKKFLEMRKYLIDFRNMYPKLFKIQAVKKIYRVNISIHYYLMTVDEKHFWEIVPMGERWALTYKYYTDKGDTTTFFDGKPSILFLLKSYRQYVGEVPRKIVVEEGELKN